jgi:hypothetical protein
MKKQLTIIPLVMISDNYISGARCLNKECYPRIAVLSSPTTEAFSEESGSFIPA